MDKTAQRFLERNWQPDDRLAFVLIGQDKRAQQVLVRARHAPGLLPLLENANRERNIHVSVNGLTEDARGRTKEDVGVVRHIFADFDQEAKERIAGMIQSGRVPRPNEIIGTSPGKAQVLWKVDGFGKDQAEVVSRGLAAEFGSDPAATDVARVMRVPGFINRKPEYAAAPPYVGVTVVHGRVSTPDQFPAYPLERQWTPSRGAERHQARSGDVTQSHRDWARVRQALRDGVDPSELRAALAADRTDKPKPGQYAERTVRLAAESLRSQGRGR